MDQAIALLNAGADLKGSPEDTKATESVEPRVETEEA
jgi:hypothetical protein